MILQSDLESDGKVEHLCLGEYSRHLLVKANVHGDPLGISQFDLSPAIIVVPITEPRLLPAIAFLAISALKLGVRRRSIH